MSATSKLLSGVIIDNSGWDHSSATSSSAFAYQPFTLPSDLARGADSPVLPSLSGFQVLVGVGTDPTLATINWSVEQFVGGTWTVLRSGDQTGAHVANQNQWLTVAFDTDIALTQDDLATDFRIGLKTPTGSITTWAVDQSTFDPARQYVDPAGAAQPWTAALRVLATIADSGTDYLGNVYRSAVVSATVDSVQTGDEGYWLSKPNPSKFAVESMYVKLAEDGQSPVVVDTVLLDPITPGVYFHIYYSTEQTVAPEDKLWIPVQKTFKADKKDSYVLPEPITARWVKIDFTQLQARYYAPGNFQKPIRFQKYPKWVLDYFLARYALSSQDFLSRSVEVTYNALDLAFNYYAEDLKQEPLDPTSTAPVDTSTLDFLRAEDASVQVDPTTLQRIRTAFRPFLDRPGLLGRTDYALGSYLQSTDSLDSNYSSEQITLDVGDTQQVSSLEREPVIIEKSFPVMWFYITCRHSYRESEALFERDKAYFAGVRTVAFLREQYGQTANRSLLIESLNDLTNMETGEPLFDTTATDPPPSPGEPPALANLANWKHLGVGVTDADPTSGYPPDGPLMFDYIDGEGAKLPDNYGGYTYYTANWEGATDVQGEPPVPSSTALEDAITADPDLLSRWLLNDAGTTFVDTHGGIDGAVGGSVTHDAPGFWIHDWTANPDVTKFYQAPLFPLTVTEGTVDPSTTFLNETTVSPTPIAVRVTYQIVATVTSAYFGTLVQVSESKQIILDDPHKTVDLSWSAVPGATYYRIYRRVDYEQASAPGQWQGYFNGRMDVITALTYHDGHAHPQFYNETPLSTGPSKFGWADFGNHYQFLGNSPFTIIMYIGGDDDGVLGNQNDDILSNYDNSVGHGWAISRSSNQIYFERTVGFTTDTVTAPQPSDLCEIYIFTYDGATLSAKAAGRMPGTFGGNNARFPDSDWGTVIGGIGIYDTNSTASTASIPAHGGTLRINSLHGQTSIKLGDIQVYSRAFTDSEMSDRLSLNNDGYESGTYEGYVYEPSYNGFTDFAYTLKYNIGNDGQGTIRNFRNTLGEMPAVGIAVKVSEDRKRYLGCQIMPSGDVAGMHYGIAWILAEFGNESYQDSGPLYGSYYLQEFMGVTFGSAAGPSDLPVAANAVYWLRMKAQGNLLTSEHWDTDPALGGTPVWSQTATLTDPNLIAKFGAGVAGGLGLSWWFADPAMRLLDTTVDVL